MFELVIDIMPILGEVVVFIHYNNDMPDSLEIFTYVI